MRTIATGILRGLRRAAVTALLAITAGHAWATDPQQVSFTLEGCRNDGSITLPIAGKFICPDTVYTTGNLGKGWNELDLVPYRVTMRAGNSAPASQTYTVAYVVDNIDDNRPGYDVLSVMTLNTALSHASCPSTPTVGSEQILSPGLGGIDSSRYRKVTLTQLKNTTCVYDFYARLALGSHLWPGASLHANMANENLGTAGIGARDVSIPVKDILPQELDKDMSAVADGTQAWDITKEADTANISFGDVCEAGAPKPQPVKITIRWTKKELQPGVTTLITHIYATNPAARSITINVTDKIYTGLTTSGTLLGIASASAVVAANTTMLVLTHQLTTTGAVGASYNDEAEATYTDTVTNVAIPGTTKATATATATQGSTANSYVAVVDREVISGTGLTFSVATPSIGSFLNGYVSPNQATQVAWGVDNQTDSGSVVLNKNVHLDTKRVTTGVLSDRAVLVGSDGFTDSTNRVDVNVWSSASVKLTLNKTIPNIVGTGEKVEVKFNVKGSTQGYEQDHTLVFTAGQTSKSVDLTGLQPDNYTVTEVSATFFADANDPGSPVPLTPTQGNQQSVDMSLGAGGLVRTCAESITFTNEITRTEFPRAQVQKITYPTLQSSDPDYTWVFTLRDPSNNVLATANAGAGAGYVNFNVFLQAEGTYTVTETLKAGWDLTSVSPQGTGQSCQFAINFPQDLGTLKSCTFTNTKRGKAEVVKTVTGAPPSGDHAFTFQLRSGASTVASGTILETKVANAANGGQFAFSTLLVPGQTYQICEVVLAGWMSTLGTFVPDSFYPPDGLVPNPNVDNSILCGNFTVDPGQTKVFRIDNSPPPGGRALTIGFWKNHASCTSSNGNQDPVLDETLNGGTLTVGSLVLSATTAQNCSKIVRLLDKRDFTGKKRASDPVFNMVAQLIAAKLNLMAGAYTCPAVVQAINEADALLTLKGFNGTTYASLTKAQANRLNYLAGRLDDYNNNRPNACNPL